MPSRTRHQSGVFSEVQTAAVPRTSALLEPATVRSRLVQVDTQKITAARRGRGVLKLNLFDDEVVQVQIKRVRPGRSGYFISGTPEGAEWGEVRLVVNGPVMVGTVVTPKGKFTIRSAASGRHIIRQIDPAKEWFECAAEEAGQYQPSALPAISSVQPPQFGAGPPRPAQAEYAPTEDGSEIRMLVVYTPALEAEQGGPAGMHALIDLLIGTANQAFEDSGISPRLVLAHAAKLNNPRAPSARDDLFRLMGTEDGYMDEVHVLRNKYAADLVHLLTSGPSGIAWGTTQESLAQENSGAFAVTARGNEMVFVHETGHNLGLRHDRYTAEQQSGPYPYAFGYVNPKVLDPEAPATAWWRTIMAYPTLCANSRGRSCPSLLRFSNPDQSYLGDPLGVPADSPATGTRVRPMPA